jgi:hypothetical protein
MNKEQLSTVLCLFSYLFYLMGNKNNKETLSRFTSILDFPDAPEADGFRYYLVNGHHVFDFQFAIKSPKLRK